MTTNSTPEEIAAIMMKVLSASDDLWAALPEDNALGDELLRAALLILMQRVSEICV
jgi:hypothetical protein